MSRSARDDRQRLFQLDEELHAEADRILAGSGLGEIIWDEGFEPQGSYVMRTMTWRDLDFERNQASPDWASHWVLGERLAATGWPWRASCINAYREPDTREHGLYWGLRVLDPSVGAGAPVWKIDLWTGRAEEFAAQCPHRHRWQAGMTDDDRYHILKIKEAVCTLPEYRKTMLSVHVYEAVLDCGVRGVEEFMQWWLSHR